VTIIRFGLGAIAALAVLTSAPVARADVTLRAGEQDTCTITGITTVAYDAKQQAGQIRFDLSKLPKGAKCVRAVLRFWINGFVEHRRWGFGRWREKDFDGFKVYAGKAPAGKPLDTKYPFNLPTYWLFEFDVTPPVKAWLADPAKNEGLAANFAFPADRPGRPVDAWMRPYLQITLAGANPKRPAQPTGLKAACRHGQVFLTWKQIPHTGAFFDSTYRVYRHSRPITAANLDKATLLGEVHRLSQLNARRTMIARGGGYCQQGLYAEAAGAGAKKDGESRRDCWDRQRKSIPQRFNYVIDHDWPAKIDGGKWLAQPPKDKTRVTLRGGPQLPDDTGLFVCTVPADGKAFYAVTSVINGNENRDDFGPPNALAAAVSEKKATPRPVCQAVFISNKGSHWNTWQIRDLAYWEGGDGRFHNTPSTALNCTMDVNKYWAGLAGTSLKPKHPVWIMSYATLSGYSTHYGRGGGSRLYDKAGMTMDTYYLPPTPRAPFPNAAGGPNVQWPEYGLFYYGTAKPPAPDAPFGLRRRGDYPYHRAHGLYGYMETAQTGRDPRKATAVPYWENRRLFEVQSLLATFPQADPNNVIVAGQWGGLAFAMHHADAFGCVNCTMEGAWRTRRGAAGTFELVGPETWGLKNPEGVNVWDWNDPIWYSKRFPRRDWPFVTHVISGNYDGVGCWANMGYPKLYFDLAKEKRAGEYWWVNVGDAPEGAYSYIPRGQAVPAIFNVTCQLPPREDFADEPAGTLNGYVHWHWKHNPIAVRHTVRPPRGQKAPTPPAGRPIAYGIARRGGYVQAWGAVALDDVDAPDRFEMAFRLTERVQGFGTGVPVPPVRVLCGAADITPRRCRKFKPAPGKAYHWKNVRVATGQVLQAGRVAADALGRVTAPKFFLDKDLLGNKLIITPAAGPLPKADENRKVTIDYYANQADRARGANRQTTKLTFADYRKQCLEPELLLAVGPGRRFVPTVTPAQVAEQKRYSEWAWRFNESFAFPGTARYRIEMRVKDAYFQHGAWPIVPASIDNKGIGFRVADSPRAMRLTWWADLAKGRHRVGFASGNHVFNESCPHVPNGKNRGLTVEHFEFVRLPRRPATVKEVYQVRIRQRSAVIAPNMPLALSADAIDPWGRPADATVTWRVGDGAKVTAEGAFSAGKAGGFKVTASAGGKTDTVTVTVKGGGFVEDFDDEVADGWTPAGEDAWEKKEKANWYVWRKGTGWMGTLLQTTSDWGIKSGRVHHLFVYEASRPWSDVAITADRLPGRLDTAQGIVFRYQGPKNYYRFERRKGGTDGNPDMLRLVKVAAGAETLLKSVRAAPAPLKLTDPATHRTFQHWGKANLAQLARRAASRPQVFDRFQVVCRGGKFTCSLNGKEVLSADDGAFATGAVGLYCQGRATFDNVTVTPAK